MMRISSGTDGRTHANNSIEPRYHRSSQGTLVAPNELPAQTEQVFENLRAILEANGATFADVVKIHTYFTTLDGLAESREVRLRYLPAEPPASTAVRVVALVVPEAVIEVDVVAVVPS